MNDPKNVTRELSRRNLLAGGAALLAASSPLAQAQTPAPGLKVAVFSKHLRFLEGEALAKSVSDLGFDGIDLTVRKAGHVLPEEVSVQLPKLVKIIRDQGLQVPMITTDIVDASSANAEQILRSCSELGIHYYRWGGFKYNAKESIPDQLDAMKPRIAKLAALNKRYNTCAIYHTHSGVDVVGASIWDLYILLKEFDPSAVAVNYDVAHATIEGGLGGWINSLRVTGPHLKGIAVKDFTWVKTAGGKWKVGWCPMGQGMVHFQQFFEMVKASRFSGPLQLHFEYPLGGADEGKSTLTISQQEVFAAMKHDLQQLRGYLKESGLAT